jgi:hypothetical protein
MKKHELKQKLESHNRQRNWWTGQTGSVKRPESANEGIMII